MQSGNEDDEKKSGRTAFLQTGFDIVRRRLE
jgi:hypothetical protein